MKRRINKPQSILALATLLAWAALCLTACINQGFDPDDNSPHAHLTLLQLGNVTIADAQTAPAGTTRAATAEDPATGFIGIRKTTFVAGDKLTLSFFAAGTSTHPYAEKEASYDGTAWTLGERIFTAAGTIIRATYSPAAPPAGHTYKDDLTSEDIELPVNGDKTTIPMKHINAMIEVTPPAGKTVADVVVKATFYGKEQKLPTAAEVTTVSGKDATIYRTIADPGSDRDPGTVTAITLTIDGNAYTATLATALTVEGNKRYPIALSMKENELIATVGTASLGWGAGTDMNLDYTRTIATPEDLAQFAHEVNNNLNGANTAVVLQTADIDLSKLKTAADANTAAGTSKYTYTATAEQWTPIGPYNNPFMGTYNGNGHTISNLKMTNQTNIFMGLFGDTKEAKFTGIHIRDCALKSDNARFAGALICTGNDIIVTLCSTTGTIEVTKEEVYAGGLIATTTNLNSRLSQVNRCSSAVNVTCPISKYASGFVGDVGRTIIASCVYSGNITFSSNSQGVVGNVFSHTSPFGYHYFCAFTGTVNNGSYPVSVFGEKVFNIASCFAIGNYDTFASSLYSTNYEYAILQDNVVNGTLATGITGVTADVAASGVYNELTANDVITPETFIDGSALIKTLHWNQADGYTLTLVERRWKASEAWTEDPNKTGLPTLNLAYEGETAAAP